MKKIILVDGNNLMFRSYYATLYSGAIMKNSEGFPTNALYGFVSMINKIIEEEKPAYMAVAFDIGKNFRLLKYKDYKAGRNETPVELKMQMPVAREILDAMGIKHFEMEPYEADDIIGTFAKMAEVDPEYDATIVSSDRDLLQLISNEVDVKLLKQKGFIRLNPETFYEEYGINPINIIDLKALSGDSSDNIPGVKGVGDKTALTLLQKYGNIEAIYENIDEIKGKLQEKLINDKESAFFSKELATIYKDVPLDVDLDNITYNGPDEDNLMNIYEKYGFTSLIRKMDIKEKTISKDVLIINDINEINFNDLEYAYYIENDKYNYHYGNILGMGLVSENNYCFIRPELIIDVLDKLKDKKCFTHDTKKNIVLLNKISYDLKEVSYDLMIAVYLLNYSLKDDIAYLMNNTVSYYDELVKTNFMNINEVCVKKADFILNTKDKYLNELDKEEMTSLFTEIEMPLTKVLAKMEINGINVSVDILKEMQEEIKIKLNILADDIYNMAGEKFNISSPKQLGDILFDKLCLPFGKKTKSGSYGTDVKVLHKLINKHPIINKIMEYRNLNKLFTTYLEGLPNYICGDGKIHTIYKQTLTRTGRLSSIEPNMQNIPTRDEEGKKIRKAFVPSDDSVFLSTDYSQIELRILAHISNCKELIEAFNTGKDIHTKVASDIFGVNEMAVTKEMRKAAKAVIFGIVYGISGFGLGENLEINPKDAKEFIEKYYNFYPGVKEYMDNIVIQAKNDGYVKTLFNRKRVIEELSSSNFMVRNSGERIALNTPIQGTSADIIKKAMVEIDKEFSNRNIKSKMILQVHDELIFDVIEEEKDIVENIVKDKMENVIKLSVPLLVSTDYGTDWYETK